MWMFFKSCVQFGHHPIRNFRLWIQCLSYCWPTTLIFYIGFWLKFVWDDDVIAQFKPARPSTVCSSICMLGVCVCVESRHRRLQLKWMKLLSELQREVRGDAFIHSESRRRSWRTCCRHTHSTRCPSHAWEAWAASQGFRPARPRHVRDIQPCWDSGGSLAATFPQPLLAGAKDEASTLTFTKTPQLKGFMSTVWSFHFWADESATRESEPSPRFWYFQSSSRKETSFLILLCLMIMSWLNDWVQVSLRRLLPQHLTIWK